MSYYAQQAEPNIAQKLVYAIAWIVKFFMQENAFARVIGVLTVIGSALLTAWGISHIFEDLMRGEVPMVALLSFSILVGLVCSFLESKGFKAGIVFLFSLVASLSIHSYLAWSLADGEAQKVITKLEQQADKLESAGATADASSAIAEKERLEAQLLADTDYRNNARSLRSELAALPSRQRNVRVSEIQSEIGEDPDFVKGPATTAAMAAYVADAEAALERTQTRLDEVNAIIEGVRSDVASGVVEAKRDEARALMSDVYLLPSLIDPARALFDWRTKRDVVHTDEITVRDVKEARLVMVALIIFVFVVIAFANVFIWESVRKGDEPEKPKRKPLLSFGGQASAMSPILGAPPPAGFAPDAETVKRAETAQLRLAESQAAIELARAEQDRLARDRDAKAELGRMEAQAEHAERVLANIKQGMSQQEAEAAASAPKTSKVMKPRTASAPSSMTAAPAAQTTISEPRPATSKPGDFIQPDKNLMSVEERLARLKKKRA